MGFEASDYKEIIRIKMDNEPEFKEMFEKYKNHYENKKIGKMKYQRKCRNRRKLYGI